MEQFIFTPLQQLISFYPLDLSQSQFSIFPFELILPILLEMINISLIPSGIFLLQITPLSHATIARHYRWRPAARTSARLPPHSNAPLMTTEKK